MDLTLLPAIAAFIQVARFGSFTRAAGELGVSPSALSQTIRALEAKLEVRLLNRSTRSVSLTEQGRLFLQQVGPGIAALEQAVGTVADSRGLPAGELRVNTSRFAARHLVEPFLGEFFAAYPQVRLELVMEDGFSDIIAQGCDAGIRLGEHLSDSMIAVPISPVLTMAVVGSPAYFAAHPPPQTPADLAGHNCLRYRQTSSGAVHPWEFCDPAAPQRVVAIDAQGCFTTNDDEGMRRAALQGVGLIQHIVTAVRDDVAAGRLISVLDDWRPSFPGFYLYAPSRAQMPLKLRVFIDFLVGKRGQG
jgi:DNA-binding transcriptional LysR family regulator